MYLTNLFNKIILHKEMMFMTNSQKQLIFIAVFSVYVYQKKKTNERKFFTHKVLVLENMNLNYQ